MTVSYSGDAYSVSFAVYWQLLFRYRGSAWKVVYPEMIVIGGTYAILSMIYRIILQDPWKHFFELTIVGVARVLEEMPMGFILGFYVTMIYGRFWKQFLSIPYPTKLATLFTTYVIGKDEKTVMLRRTLIRYITLSWVMAFRTMNIPIKKRFPTMEHLVNAGLITASELESFQKLQSIRLDASYFVPLAWSASLLQHACNAKKIRHPAGLVDILAAIDEYRKALQTATMYDSVNVPLVYTQAVVFGTYSYFVASTVGFQFIPEERFKMLEAEGYDVPNRFCSADLVVPVFAIIQLFIYAGLFKVAESLLNPHGENDDDFEICSEIDKNLADGYLIVTDMHGDEPELITDMFWDLPEALIPYTHAANAIRERRPNPTAHFGSLFQFSVKHGTDFLAHAVNREAFSDNLKPAQEPPPEVGEVEQSQTSVCDNAGEVNTCPPTPFLLPKSNKHGNQVQPDLLADTLAILQANKTDKPVCADLPLQFVDDPDGDWMSVDGGIVSGLTRRKRH